MKEMSGIVIVGGILILGCVGIILIASVVAKEMWEEWRDEKRRQRLSPFNEKP